MKYFLTMLFTTVAFITLTSTAWAAKVEVKNDSNFNIAICHNECRSELPDASFVSKDASKNKHLKTGKTEICWWGMGGNETQNFPQCISGIGKTTIDNSTKSIIVTGHCHYDKWKGLCRKGARPTVTVVTE